MKKHSTSTPGKSAGNNVKTTAPSVPAKRAPGKTTTQPLPGQSQRGGQVATTAATKASQTTPQNAKASGSNLPPGGNPATGGEKSIYDKLIEDEKQFKRPMFTGYPCLESRQGLLSSRYVLDKEPGVDSINKNPAKIPTVNIGSQKESIIGVNSIRKGMTLGEAIQKVIMTRNREENARTSGGKDLRFTKIPSAVLTDKTLPPLYIGDIIDSTNVQGLASRNIGAILSIHPIDFRSARQRELGYSPAPSSRPIQKLIQLEDDAKADFLSEASAGIAFIHQNRVAGKAVLVHCAAGRSRSYAFIQGYLTWEKYAIDYQKSINSRSTDDERKKVYEALAKFTRHCFETIKVERPVISMDNFGDQIDEYAAKLVNYKGFNKKKPDTSSQKKKGGEIGGGARFTDSVAIAFFVYDIRPTRQVITFYRDRRAKYKWPAGLDVFYSKWAAIENMPL